MPEEADNRYWGKLAEYSDEYGAQVIRRYNDHQELIYRTNLANRMARSWCQYHARDENGYYDTSDISYSGEKGEVTETRINEYRSLLRTKLALAVSKPLTFQALALNDNSTSLNAALKAQSVLKHYEARGGLRSARRDLAETGMVMSAAWLTVLWDRTIGPEKAADPDTGEIVYDGDVRYDVLNPFQTAYDRSSEDVRDPRWFTARARVNKYQLATELPEYQEDILDTEAVSAVSGWSYDRLFFCDDDPDYIYVFKTFFRPSPLVPVGRMSITLPSAKVVYDGKSSYSRVPALMFAPSIEIGESGLPYGDDHDLLMPVELIQDATSTLSSQHDAAIPVLWTQGKVKRGHLQSFVHLEGGEQKPETLHLYKPNEHSYQWIGHLRGTTHQISQVNPAMLGAPDASSSGSKTAFQVSTGMSQQKPFTGELDAVMEDGATLTIEVLRTHMSEDRIVSITGLRGKSQSVRFKKPELALVQSVVVKTADPMLDSPQGRQHVADIGAERGWFNSPQEYITAYVTGATDVMTGDDTDHYILIRSENEQILAALDKIPTEVQDQCNQLIKAAGPGADIGQQVARLIDPYLTLTDLPVVCETDLHRSHVETHSFLLYDDELRHNALAKHLVQAHNLQHVLALTPGTPLFNPQILQVTGQKPLAIQDPSTGSPTVPADQQPPGAEGMPDTPQGSPPKQPGIDGKISGAAVPGRPPNLPKPPTNPGSGNAAPTPALEGASTPPGARS